MDSIHLSIHLTVSKVAVICILTWDFQVEVFSPKDGMPGKSESVNLVILYQKVMIVKSQVTVGWIS